MAFSWVFSALQDFHALLMVFFCKVPLTLAMKLLWKTNEIHVNYYWIFMGFHFIVSVNLFSIWLLLTQVYFHPCQIFFMSKSKQTQPFLRIFIFKEAKEVKVWLNQGVQNWTNNIFALSNCGSYFNQEEWLKKLEDTCPADEAERLTTTTASHTK